jgi:heme A synthase
VRVAAGLALALVLAQVTVGFLSVSSILAVVPVSLHTLGAAALMAVVALLATWGRMRDPERSGVGA